MHREIKFRAWLRDGGWDAFDEKQDFIMVDGDSLAFEDYDLLCNLIKDEEDEKYFMQYTGLKDKNGAEIYEGDVVEGFDTKFIVRWGVMKIIKGFPDNPTTGSGSDLFLEPETHNFNEVEIPSYYFDAGDGIPLYPIVKNHNRKHDLEELTVIGNIYENPELLSQKHVLSEEEE
jgi:hypothetical protein